MSNDGFLLGHLIDPASGDKSGADVDYDPSDLTTHGVIIGMTGSGKTGLGVILLEEALRSGLPALVIDPKGDMGNLELLFPDFDPTDFEPWVSADEARQKGISTAELGQKTANLWKNGIAGWDPGLEAIRRLHDTVDVTIYTPHENKELMFEMPRLVIKSGGVIVEQGEIRDPLIGKTLHVAPAYDLEVEPDIQAWFEKYYSIQWRNYPVDISYLHEPEAVG